MNNLEATKSEIYDIKAKISELYSQLKVRQKVIIEMIGGDISAYLTASRIDGGKYKFLNANFEDDSIEIRLTHHYADGDIESIDEDFSSDKHFDKFLKSMAEKYGVKRVKVPYWYYSK